tara:strand:- start:12 stop:338 length:327 start_codon:yes stop_codon:yes gene_type:complete
MTSERMDTYRYTGHTEGPWENFGGDIYAASGEHIADTVLNMVIPQEEAHANTRLIADAPLLLAEVKRLDGIIYDALYVLQSDGWNKNRADAINRLEKILFRGWVGEEE